VGTVACGSKIRPNALSYGNLLNACISQIMNLSHLAPEIHEAVLFLPRVESGKDPITERDLRPIAALADWGRQRGMWEATRRDRLHGLNKNG